MLNRDQNRNFYSHYHRSESGQGFVEYALILILVAIVVAAVVNTMRPAIADVFSRFVERAAVAPPALLDYTPPPPPPPPPPGGGDPDPVCYSLTLTSNGPGDIIPNIPPNCDDEDQPDKYNEGTMVTLEAVASTGYAFGGWSQALAGHTNPDQIVMDGNKSVTAAFLDESDCSAVDYTIVGNGAVTMDPPPNCGEELYLTGTGVNFTAVSGTGYIFDMWSGGLTGSNQTTGHLILADLTFTAHFVEHCFDVDVNIVGDGDVSISPEASCTNGGFPAGQEVTFTAVSNSPDYVFGGWSGASSSNTTPLTLAINQDMTLTATFNQCHTLSETIIGNGNINISTSYNCSGERFQTGTAVELAAIATPGHGFVQWSGAASGPDSITTIIMDDNKNVTATFTQCFALTTNVQPTNIGSVTLLTGFSASCNGNYFLPGTEVNIQGDPNPNNGYEFGSWSGDATGSNNPTNFVINDNATVTANFICDLNSPWQNSSIGSGAGGQACQSSGTFAVTGSGGDIWGSTDRFHYAYQQRTGDFTIVARVNSQTNTGQWAKAGVMIRENLNAGSRYAFAAVTPGNGTRFQYRPNANSNSQSSGVGGTAPRYLMLERQGNTFTAYHSSNGIDWTEYASQTVNMGNTVYYGLAASSHNSNSSTAVFTNVSIEEPPACYTIATAVNPANSGSINLSPTFNCDGGYTDGTSATATAAPNPGYQFDSWGGALSGTTNPQNFTVNDYLDLIATFSLCSPANVVQNPGFESGLDPWNLAGNVGTTTDARSGSLAAEMTGTGMNHRVSQFLPAVPGYEYTASVWAKRRQAGWANIGLIFHDSNWNQLATSNSPLIDDRNNYQFNSHTATAPANAAFVTIIINAGNFQNDNSFIILDDVELMAPVCN
jgi:Flp pilus assembly pilin Flp/regulation of enolase protein 1 (concanavalin A-like superfamily)